MRNIIQHSIRILLIWLFLYSYAFAGTISSSAKDWLGNTMTGVSVRVYVFALTGTGDTTRIDGNTFIAETTSNSTTGAWEINDADVVSGTEYFVVEYYGSSYTAADGKTLDYIVSTRFMTAN